MINYEDYVNLHGQTGKCPYCDSEKITYGSRELEGEQLYYESTCDNCNRSYHEYYDVTFSENWGEKK